MASSGVALSRSALTKSCGGSSDGAASISSRDTGKASKTSRAVAKRIRAIRLTSVDLHDTAGERKGRRAVDRGLDALHVNLRGFQLDAARGQDDRGIADLEHDLLARLDEDRV